MFILMSLSHGSPNLQLDSAAFHLFKSARNPSSQVADLAAGARLRITSSFITSLLRLAARLAKRKLPSRSRQVSR